MSETEQGNGSDANELAMSMLPRPPVDEAKLARGVDAARKAFLDAALRRHLGPEIRADLPGIVASYGTSGHLRFNGVVYDTPERLHDFHRAMGFDGRGLLAGLGATIEHVSYTHDSVIVEYTMWGTTTAEIVGSAAGREVTFASCGVYEFAEDGTLRSERIYLDTGSWLAEPVFRP